MKKQLNTQALSFSLVLFLSWFSFSAFEIIPGLGKVIAGKTNTFKYTIADQFLALLPVAVMIAITLALNYILKPDLGRYSKTHITFGLVTILICTMLLFSFTVLPSWAGGSLYSSLALLHINLYWIVPVVSLLIEAGYYFKQRMYQKPRELIVLLASSASIGLLLTYAFKLFVIGLSI